MPVRVALHPRHGRNRLYVVTGSDCSILVKQDNLRSLQSRECLAYHLLGETAFTQPPIFSVPELHLTAFRLDADCVTLEDLARTNLRLTLRLLEELAVHALALYDLEPVPALPPHRTMIDYPLPWLDQVQDTSASFRSLLIEAQKRDLLKRCVYEGPSQLHFSHGDLKLDNILLTDRVNRVFFTGISDRMLALDLGAVVTDGTPDEVVNHPQVIASYLGSSQEVINRSGSSKAPAPRRRRDRRTAARS